MTSIGGRAVQYSHWNGFDLNTKTERDKLKEDQLEKKPSCVDDSSLYHTAHTTISIKIKVSSDTNEHHGSVALACEARLGRDDSGTDVGFDESWSWRCLLRVEGTGSQW